MMNDLRVLGIDPGLATVGYAVVEYGGQNQNNKNGHAALSVYGIASAGHPPFHMVEAGVISTSADWNVQPRLQHIYEETCALINEHRPHALAIEKLFFKKNVTTGIVVAQARGVLLLAAHELTLREYAPVEVKRRVAGSGKAQKFQVQAMTQRLLGLRHPPRPDDAADAIAVALCCLLELNQPQARMFHA